MSLFMLMLQLPNKIKYTLEEIFLFFCTAFLNLVFCPMSFDVFKVMHAMLTLMRRLKFVLCLSYSIWIKVPGSIVISILDLCQ